MLDTILELLILITVFLEYLESVKVRKLMQKDVSKKAKHRRSKTEIFEDQVNRGFDVSIKKLRKSNTRSMDERIGF